MAALRSEMICKEFCIRQIRRLAADKNSCFRPGVGRLPADGHFCNEGQKGLFACVENNVGRLDFQRRGYFTGAGLPLGAKALHSQHGSCRS